MNVSAQILVAILVVATVGCSTNEYAASPNFDEERGVFVNTDGSANDKPFLDFLKFAYALQTRDPDPIETAGFPVRPYMETALRADQASVTWVGHATLLVAHSGKHILTDPFFSERASPVSFAGPKRVTPVPMTIEELPEIDMLLVSHNHYDHLDLPTLERLAQLQPDIDVVVPLGLGSYLEESGFTQVTELDWWNDYTGNELQVTATPMQHWSSRSLTDKNQTLWAGFMVTFADGYRFYFAGDTGYSDDFKETRKRLGSPNLAAFPIGAYAPRDFMHDHHANPEEAVQMYKDLGADKGVAIHWGTVKLTLEPLAEPPQRLAQALKASNLDSDSFRTLEHGETWIITIEQ